MHRGILALILTAMLITVSVAIDSIPQAEGAQPDLAAQGNNIDTTAEALSGPRDSFPHNTRPNRQNTTTTVSVTTTRGASTTTKPTATTTRAPKSVDKTPKSGDKTGGTSGGADSCVIQQIAAEGSKASGNGITAVAGTT